ncbi:MAG: adenine deaminase [Sulfolobales archaeon]
MTISRLYDTKILAWTALGRVKADLVIKDTTLVNVYSGEILDNIDIAIKEDRVAYVGEKADHVIGSNTTIINGKGLYAVPGFLDGHMHIESSMITPTQFARAVLPWGTTGVFPDPHEIGNVLGVEGIKIFIEESRNLPLKIFWTVPSCVPTTNHLETAGATIDSRDVEELMKLPEIYGLGEMMNYYGLLEGDEEVHKKIQATLKYGKIVTGHAAGLGYKELAAYAAAGVHTCHEATTKEEVLHRVRLGMCAKLRYGSAWHDLPHIIKALTETKIDSRKLTIITDDIHPEDLLSKGHLNWAVRKAIEEGVDPVTAIQMVTINIAECYKVSDHVGGIAPGKYADIVLLKSLTKVDPKLVIASGKVVANDKKLLIDLPSFKYPEHFRKTIRLRKPLQPDDFKIMSKKMRNGVTKVRVMHVFEGSVPNKHIIEELEVMEGEIMPSVEKDIIRVAVVERHRATGNIGLGFVKGFGIREGAVASTVAHDSHNMIIAGVDREDMAHAGNKLAEVGGGMIAVRNREVLALVELPIAGLLSDEPVEIVAEKVNKLKKAWRDLGSSIESPFMTFSILALTVLPELRISDRGLVDTTKGVFVDIEVSD